MQRQEDPRSLGDLFAELATETTTLVRQEFQLARTEMAQKATEAGKDLGIIGAGGALAYAGLLAVIAALIIGLGELIPLWLSALIVGLIVGGSGYFMVQRGLSALKQIDPKPQQTIQTLQEDKEWVKEQAS